MKQTKQVELLEELQKKLEVRLHDFIRQLLDKDLGYEEDDYDEYFDEDGRVSTSSPSGCTYHKDLKFFIKNDLAKIIAQAQQEAYDKGFRDGIKKTTEHTQALNDLAVKSLREALQQEAVEKNRIDYLKLAEEFEEEMTTATFGMAIQGMGNVHLFAQKLEALQQEQE